MQRADADQRAVGADQRRAAPKRMRGRREHRLVEVIFPVAGEFLLGDDARPHRLRDAAAAGDDDGFADRRASFELPNVIAGRSSSPIACTSAEAGLRIDGDRMGRHEAAARVFSQTFSASVTR